MATPLRGEVVEVDRVRRRAQLDARTPLRIYAQSRLLVTACALFAVAIVDRDPANGPWPRYGSPHVPAVQVFGRWDGAWYIALSKFGYDNPLRWGDARYASRAFFPGYPALVRIASSVTQVPELVVAVAITLVVGAVAAVLAWQLVCEISGASAASRAVTLLCFSPGAFVLSMAYSEALFLMCALVAVRAQLQRRWWTAGVAIAVAGFTRPNGFALLAASAVVALVAVVRDRDWTALRAPAVGSLGVVAFFGYLFVRTSDPLYWFRVERRGWGDHVAPVAAVVDHVRGIPRTSLQSGGLNDLVWITFAAVGVACAVALIRWRPPLPVMAYGILAGLMALGSYQVGLRPRMLLIAFPLILAVGVQLEGRAFRIALSVSVGLLALFSVLTFGTLSVAP